MLQLALALACIAPMASQDPTSGAPPRGGDRLTGAPFASRSAVIARHGMAATSHPLASQAALDVLKAGGSAVDAAIAANAVLALAEPTGSGLGGDLFAIVWDPRSERLHGLNASGRSPRGLSLAQLRELVGERGRIPSLGPLPVSVPGASAAGAPCTSASASSRWPRCSRRRSATPPRASRSRRRSPTTGAATRARSSVRRSRSATCRASARRS